MSVIGLIFVGLLGILVVNNVINDHPKPPQENKLEVSDKKPTVKPASFLTFNKMPGLSWQAANLKLKTEASVCWDNMQNKCDEKGRLYTWVDAKKACEQLGSGWRLLADTKWRELTRLYGGAYGDPKTHTTEEDSGKYAYKELVGEDESGFEGSLAGK
ncbi:MAG: hypothetical protein ACI9FR_003357 [Cryomorphaceae bacterium]|jgi:hypothetical protein